MEASNDQRMMTFHIPTEPILACLGTIALRHGHLDYILRMTIKSLAGVSIRQALDATAFEGSRTLRQRIQKLASRRLGEGKALLQLQALLERCRRASEERNELTHNIWAKELDGDPKIRDGNHDWNPLPTIDDLTALANELEAITVELNDARLNGFLAEVLTAKM